MSYFEAPVKTVVPRREVSVEEVYRMIKEDEGLRLTTEQVRSAEDYVRAKQTLLPFVTPCGTFTYRKAAGLKGLSGVLPIDIDKLPSQEAAEELRDRLFADSFLEPVLCYVSPSGRGVKAFVPYEVENAGDVPQAKMVSDAIFYTMAAVRSFYGSVDTTGKDVCRCAFLCHDPNAKFRI